MAKIPPEKPSEPDSLAGFLCFSLYSASHAATRLLKPLLADLALTYPQFVVLVVLWDRDDQLVSEIGGKLYLESNTLTPLLKRLESMGMVTRERDTGDERRVRVRLTKSGKALRRRTAPVSRLLLEASGLNASEFAQLTAQIAALRDRISSHPLKGTTTA